MKRLTACTLAVIACALPALAAPPADQAAVERGFDAAIHPQDLRGWMQHMAAQPNQVGSAHDRQNAEYEQALMLTIDQTLAPEVGLPGRPWYKNLVYAPGRLTGYGAKTLPGVREAIEERRWSEANRYIRLTADALDAYSARLDQARGVVGGK
jgi:hypothetical protein